MRFASLVLLPVVLAAPIFACDGDSGTGAPAPAGGGAEGDDSAPPIGDLPEDAACERGAGEKIALVRAFAPLEFSSPVEMVQEPGSARFYVVEQTGTVKTFLPGDAVATTALAFASSDIQTGGERGLLGFAFSPDYAMSGHVYMYYTRKIDPAPKGVDCESSIVRFTRSADGTFDPASRKVILAVEQPFANHNGGKLAFGPDGFLYIAFGDGGSGNDPSGNAQNKDVLLGKILRIDPQGGEPYAVPKDNPFAVGGGRPEIFAYGLRNPWRFSFDRTTGQLWLGDVGQGAWEEVDIVENGKNYGWKDREGFHCANPPTNCATDGFADPVAEYSHDEGVSITGGFVFRGTGLPYLSGKYLYGDFGSGTIWGLEKTGATYVPHVLNEKGQRVKISSFAEDADANLYILDYGTGGVFRIEAACK